MATYSPHCVLVVMAVDDLYSLQLAEHILLYLTHAGTTRDKAVILVANKADLVRNREVKTAAGKRMAEKYNVKYIETSPGDDDMKCTIQYDNLSIPGINHNIDELLVGIFHQICLRQEAERRAQCPPVRVRYLLHQATAELGQAQFMLGLLNISKLIVAPA